MRGDIIRLPEGRISRRQILDVSRANIAVSMLTLLASAYYKLRSLKQANTGCRSFKRNHVGCAIRVCAT